MSLLVEQVNGFSNGFDDEDSFLLLYERSRIKALSDEREVVQKKTFTKWINSHLQQENINVEDLFSDLRDGKALMKLLEILSGERLPRPSKGKMRIHCLENIDKCLNFLLEQRVHLENLGTHDIVDGNPRLVLGLIWTIILRFQIQNIVVEEEVTKQRRQAKDALLLWCQIKTAKYPKVNIRNFTSSWRDGLAFCALIHKYFPNLLNFHKLRRRDAKENLEKAFLIAEHELNIARLLEPDDLLSEKIDEKSIITYVVSYYHHFNNLRNKMVCSRRLGKSLDLAITNENNVKTYEKMSYDLLKWLNFTIKILDDRHINGSLDGVQRQLIAFNTYRNVEKVIKLNDRGNFELLYFIMQKDRLGNGLNIHAIENSVLINDINSKWLQLEKLEHSREIWLRQEVLRQEKLNFMAQRFLQKSSLRLNWLNENYYSIQSEDYPEDFSKLNAELRKHEAIETEIRGYEERISTVLLAEQLKEENYCKYDIEIKPKQDEVVSAWWQLINRLSKKKQKLNMLMEVIKNLKEFDNIKELIEQVSMKIDFNHSKNISDFNNMDDLFERLYLFENEIKSIGNEIDERKNKFESDTMESDILKKVVFPAINSVILLHESLQDKFKIKSAHLNELKLRRALIWDLDYEEHWIKTCIQSLTNPDIGHDSSSCYRLLSRHKTLEDEIRCHQDVVKDLIHRCNLSDCVDINARLEKFQICCEDLFGALSIRKDKLNYANEIFSFINDLNDVDLEVIHYTRLVSDKTTKASADFLKKTIRQLSDFENKVNNLNSQAQTIFLRSEELSQKDCWGLSSDFTIIPSKIEKLKENFLNFYQSLEDRRTSIKHIEKILEALEGCMFIEQWIVVKEKLLLTLIPSDEMEEMEMVLHRFNMFVNEYYQQKETISTIDEISNNVKCLSTEYPVIKDILRRNKKISKAWKSITEQMNNKKSVLEATTQYQKYLSHCKQISEWIKEKANVVESTDELTDDLNGILQLQRRIGSLKNDMEAIKLRFQSLDLMIAEISMNHFPDRTASVKAEREQLESLWVELNLMVDERHDRMNESTDLQLFLQDLDHFHLSLTKNQKAVASQDIPPSLQECENALADHEQLEIDIQTREPEFVQLIEYGFSITEGETDPHYMFLRQRIEVLQLSWIDLKNMWQIRCNLLSQSLSLQIFLRDCEQVETILGRQEGTLNKEDFAHNLEECQNALKQHELFQETLVANQERVNLAIEFGESLLQDKHFAMEKIQQKLQSIRMRNEKNTVDCDSKFDYCIDQINYFILFHEIEDMQEWIQERLAVVSDVSGRDEQVVYRRFNRHRAFEEEIEANRDRYEKIVEEGQIVMAERSKYRSLLEPKLTDLVVQWDEMISLTQVKGEKMLEENRALIFKEGVKDMMSWLRDVRETIIITEERVETLTDINEKLRRVETCHKEMDIKKKQIEDLKNHAEKLKFEEPERSSEIDEQGNSVEETYYQILVPIQQQYSFLWKKQRIQQAFMDFKIAMLSLGDREVAFNVLKSDSRTFINVVAKQKRWKTLVKEFDAQLESIDESINANGETIKSEAPARCDEYENILGELRNLQRTVQELAEEVGAKLQEEYDILLYLRDVDEFADWIFDERKYLQFPQKLKTTDCRQRHDDNFSKLLANGATLTELDERVAALSDTNLGRKSNLSERHLFLNKEYGSLCELSNKKRKRLLELVHLQDFYVECSNFENWLNERTATVSSNDIGRNMDSCVRIKVKLTLLSHKSIGTSELMFRKLDTAGRKLIQEEHEDRSEIVAKLEYIRELREEFIELICLRNAQLLQGMEWYKCQSQCIGVLDTINEKRLCLPKDGDNSRKLFGYNMKKIAFLERDIFELNLQVNDAVSAVNNILPLYADPFDKLLHLRRDEIRKEYQKLKYSSEKWKLILEEEANLRRFFTFLNDLQKWIDEKTHQLKLKISIRNLPELEDEMQEQEDLKTDISLKRESINVCVNMGRNLLRKSKISQTKIKEDLIRLLESFECLTIDWEVKQHILQGKMEVFEFLRDLQYCDNWLTMHQRIIHCISVGGTLKETLRFLHEHLLFEQQFSRHVGRFEALRRLTRFELEKLELTEDDVQAAQERQMARISKASQVFREYDNLCTPLSRSKSDSLQRLRLILPETSTSMVKAMLTPKRTASPIVQEMNVTVQSSGSTVPRKVPLSKTGTLLRKRVWESTGKRAAQRNWHRIWISLNGNEGKVSFYKEVSRHGKAGLSENFQKETIFSLKDGNELIADTASDYFKKKFVFRFQDNQLGIEYLLQATNQDEMDAWISAIKDIVNYHLHETKCCALERGRDIQQASGATPGTRSSTQTRRTKDEKGDSLRRFFSLGRK